MHEIWLKEEHIPIFERLEGLLWFCKTLKACTIFFQNIKKKQASKFKKITHNINHTLLILNLGTSPSCSMQPRQLWSDIICTLSFSHSDHIFNILDVTSVWSETPWVSFEYILGVSWPPTPKDIPEPSHGRVFREKFRSAYVSKGVWSLLTDLFLNRHYLVDWFIFSPFRPGPRHNHANAVCAVLYELLF